MHARACALSMQVLHRTVSVNVLQGDAVEMSMEEVVLQRQFTVQVWMRWGRGGEDGDGR